MPGRVIRGWHRDTNLSQSPGLQWILEAGDLKVLLGRIWCDCRGSTVSVSLIVFDSFHDLPSKHRSTSVHGQRH